MKACALVVVLIACGSKDPPPEMPSNVAVVHDAGPPDAGRDHIEDVLAMMASFRTVMCKCHDKPCADAVQQRMTDWATQESRDAGKRSAEKLSDDAMKRMAQIGQEYGECMMKALTPNVGSGASPATP